MCLAKELSSWLWKATLFWSPEKQPPFNSRAVEGFHLLMIVMLQIELGTACGKLFRCSTMAILDAGDSDILNTNPQ